MECVSFAQNRKEYIRFETQF